MISKNALERIVAVVDRIATPVLLVCALIVTVIVVRREFLSDRESGAPAVRDVGDWRKYMNGGSIVGPPLAPVVIIEFSDFQCPYCARLAERLDSLRLKYGDAVAVVYRHYPISGLHSVARDAARASICADRHAVFKSYHDRLFRAQSAIGSVPWTVLAAEVGVTDTVSFRDCMASTIPDDFIRQDSMAASELEISGTPLVLLNGRLIAGAPAFSTLDSLTKEALEKSAKP
jgi:protein-disulfide isomerase